MMDIYTIRSLAKDAGRAARRGGNEPSVFTQEQIDRAKAGNRDAISGIPNLGTYLPKGWKRVSLAMDYVGDPHGIYMGDNEGKGAFFVDKSGCGAPGEAALTLTEFIKRLKPGLGYGVVEEGQFQVKVGAFAVRTA